MAITNPTDIANLWYWGDVQTLSAANDDPISNLPDLSGNSRDHTTAADTTRPLYKTSILNGHPALLFDGSNDRLGNATGLDRPVTVVLYAQHATGSVSAQTGWYSREFIRQYLYMHNGSPDTFGVYNGAVKLSSVALDASVHMIAGLFSNTPGSDGIRVDGTMDIGDTGGDDATAFAGKFGCGHAATVPNEFGNFYLFEAAIYSARLSQGNLDDLAAYFTAHWAAAGGIGAKGAMHNYRNNQ